VKFTQGELKPELKKIVWKIPEGWKLLESVQITICTAGCKPYL